MRLKSEFCCRCKQFIVSKTCEYNDTTKQSNNSNEDVRGALNLSTKQIEDQDNFVKEIMYSIENDMINTSTSSR